MRKCWGKHSCMGSTFPIAILDGNCFFLETRLSLLRSNIRLSKTKCNNNPNLGQLLSRLCKSYLVIGPVSFPDTSKLDVSLLTTIPNGHFILNVAANLISLFFLISSVFRFNHFIRNVPVVSPLLHLLIFINSDCILNVLCGNCRVGVAPR